MMSILVLTSSLWMLPIGLPTAEAARYTMGTDINMTDASFFGETVMSMDLGRSLAVVGDVNDDGYDDFAVGTEWFYGTGSHRGRVYLFFGGQDGWARGLNVTDCDASFTGAWNSEGLGTDIAGAGDVNGDGIDDMLISSLGDPSLLGYAAGKVYLIFGRTSGWERNVTLYDADASFIGEAMGDYAGLSVAGARDVNGDGYDDILIGAWGNKDGGEFSGQTYLIFGRSSGWARNVSLAAADASFVGNYHTWSGESVAFAGDVNGDGYDDILIGANMADVDSNTEAGKAHLIYGKATGWALHVGLANTDVTFLGNMAEDRAGVDVAPAGDYNGDGIDDFLISAVVGQYGYNSGASYLILGRTDGWDRNTTLNRADIIMSGTPSDYATKLGALGDVNGDGYDDFAVGAPCNGSWGVGGTGHGQVYVFLGRSSIVKKSKMLSEADMSFVGHANWSAGMRVSGDGDLDGDGYDDIVMSASYYPGVAPTTGAAFVAFPEHNSQPVSIDTIKAYADPGFTTRTSEAGMNDTVFIELNGTDANITRADIALVSVSSNLSTGFIARLTENGPHTGVYHGKITVKDQTKEERGWIRARPGDIVTVRPVRDPSMSVTVTVRPDLAISPGTGNITINEDDAFSQTFNTTFDGVRAWNATTNSTWLAFNDTSHTASGTTNNTHVGTYLLNISVQNLFGHVAMANMTLNVINRRPEISTTDVINATEGAHYLVDYNSSDDGQGTVLWALDTDAAWLSMDPSTGTLQGTPIEEDVGKAFVNVTVDDGNGGRDWSNFTLTVENVNEPPVIATGDSTTTLEDEPYIVLYNATDTDKDDMLTWHLATNASQWLTMSAEGNLSGVPHNWDVGPYWVNVSVSDGNGGEAFHNFTLTVVNVNDPPVITSTPPPNATAEEYYYYNVTATDEDGDKLTFSFDEAPYYIKINPDNGSFSWVPHEMDGDSFIHFIVNVSDGKAFALQEFNVTIHFRPHVIRPPNVDPIPDQVVKAGTNFEYEVDASDPNEYHLSFAVGDGPKGMTIDEDGKIGWTPKNSQAGTHKVRIDVISSEFTTSVYFNITVEPGPLNPMDVAGEGNGPFILLAIVLVIIIAAVLYVWSSGRKRKEREASAKQALEKHGIGTGTDAARKKGEGTGRKQVPEEKGEEDPGFVELEDDGDDDILDDILDEKKDD